mgnify:FL=1
MSILEKSTVIDLIKTRSASVATIAGTVAASSAVTTLLRCPGIRDGENETYTLTKEGEKPVCWVVDRAAIARCMVDMLADETLGANESLGITNGRA